MTLVLNIRTGHIYPQYHVVFDGNFSTVYHTRKGTVPGNWKNLVEEYSYLSIQEKFIIANEWHINKSYIMNLPRDTWKEGP